MSMSQVLVAVSLGHGRLCAVAGAVTEGRVRIRAWTSAPMPEGLDAREAAAVGGWMSGQLVRAGMSKGRLVFAVPRSEVVLKRLRLPRGEGTGEAELAGMVRLQMARQLTMTIEGTAIDYTPLGVEEPAAGAAAPQSTSVVAGALPGDRMAWYRAVAKAAGMRIERVSLKAAGISALLAGVSQRRSGPVLGIALDWGAIEFVLVENGQLVFARSADIGLASPPPSSGEGERAWVQRVAVEAKRTWMSYRVGQESAEVDAIAVVGEGALARQVGETCGEALEMPWELVGVPDAVEVPAEMPEADRLVCAPLMGLLGARLVGRASLDFAHPRRAPDLAAARRQRVLGAALVLLVAGGAAYVYADGRLARLERRVEAARERHRALSAEYDSYLLEHARLGHAREWTGVRVDWLAHASWLSEAMPDPREALLDQFGAGIRQAEVRFVPNDGAYTGGKWESSTVASFSLSGSMKDRAIANALRSALVDSGIYAVETKGQDTPDRFSFELATSLAEPVVSRPLGGARGAPR